MKIAVTYGDGQIFQHFGHTPSFKLYDVTDGAVTESGIISTNGSGHGALADMLASLKADVLICGGIGGGAQAALQDAGIRLYAGIEGDPDEAVKQLLGGTLPEVSEATCDHHHGDDHNCGESEEGHACGGPEGDCRENGCHGGSCHGCHPDFFGVGKNTGKRVRTHYRGTFNDGTQFDSSYDRGEPLEFICGAGMMIPGFDAAVADMEIGETVQVHLMPEEAYGEADPDAIFTLELAQLPGAEKLSVGQQVYLQNVYGQPIPVTVAARDDKTITFDANHEMAGKELNFTIELVDVLEE